MSAAMRRYCVTQSCAILEQWDTTAVFRRVCRLPAGAVKPGGSRLFKDTQRERIASGENLPARRWRWSEALLDKGLRPMRGADASW
jgi:hypothetical protein